MLLDDAIASIDNGKLTNNNYTPSDIGYNDTTAFFTNPKNAKLIADKVINLPKLRGSQPPGYWNYVKYNHRGSFDMYHLRIGDSCFTIPPEFISVKNTSQTEQNVSIRQDSSVKTKHGYSKKEIVITMYFNGLDQINGYEVSSPMDYTYYVDGLRSLMAQFMSAPFLPVENEFLNITNNISNVALMNLNVNTVQGFPDCLQVTLIMQEFNAVPYIEAPNQFYDNFIDWDLFRYNYQRLLNIDSNHYKHLIRIAEDTNTLTGRFVLSALDEACITEPKDASEFYDDDNFKTIVSDKDNITISEMSFSLANIIPIIQLSDHPSPTMQYLGGMDVVFSIAFETTDISITGKFAEMQTRIQSIVRKNREFNGLGFVRFDNELVNMSGTQYLMIDDVTVNTVPDFPDLYNISLQCISYNKLQRGREELNGIRPFENNRNGTLVDAISQDVMGVRNKIRQDCIAEQYLAEAELYPDLCLPTYKEINSVIPKINSFRVSNGLSQLNYTEYPNQATLMPLKGQNGKYEKYLDPDFYVFYPIRYEDIDDSLFDIIKGSAKPTPASVVGLAHDFGDEPPGTLNADGTVAYPSDSSTNSDGSSNTTSNTVKSFIDIAMSKNGCGYVWGTDGATLTSSLKNSLMKSLGADHYPAVINQWMGKQVFDCSGFVSFCLRQVGVMKSGERYGCGDLYSNECTPIGKSDLKAGDLLFRGPGEHVAIYIGNNQTIEALDSADGVKIGTLRSSFNYFGRVKGLSTGGNVSTLNVANSANANYSQTSFYTPTPSNTLGCLKGYRLGTSPVSSAVNKLRPIVAKYAQADGVQDVDLLMALIQQESGGEPNALATDPMQSAESHGMGAGTLNDVDKSIQWGVEAFKKTLTLASGNIPLVLQSYNFGPGFINYANSHGGMSQDTVNAFSDMMARQNGWSSYGDKNYAQNVLQYYSGDGSSDSGSNVVADNPDAGTIFSGKTGEYLGQAIGQPLYLESPMNHALEDGSGILSWIGVGTKYEAAIEKFELKDDDIINKACVDMIQYSAKGRLLKAFPSYVMMILDENDTWLDARKLWTNFYFYKSVVEMSVFQEYSNPVHTATIKLTNVYENLNKAALLKRDAYSILNDPEYNGLDKLIYKWTGAVIGGQKLTDNMVEQHNEIFDNVNIKAGCRIHLRMGYGSNPINYPVTFNGVIADIDTGDIVTIVAESDGAELVNNVISSNKTETNRITKLQSEPSDIIASLVTDRDNWFINMIDKNWCEKSKYGIEHFGLTMTTVSEMDQINKQQDQLNADNANTSSGASKTVNDSIGRVTLPTTTTSQGSSRQTNQYDLCKNIYIGNYHGRPFCMGSYFFNYDDENNINFFLYNKTPWDAMQISTQFIPEFVCQPLYHQFDSRVYYGLPIWCSKYRYDMQGDTIYEYGKTFSQLHYIDSFTDIIDNEVHVTSKDLYTNCVASYSVAGTSKSTPTIYADRDIDNSRQRSKVIDSSTTQDYIGPDWLYEHIGFDIAKKAAIQISLSNILDSFNNTYQGPIYILGDASIKPCDYLYMNDHYVRMNGLSTVRQVVHSLGVDTGFVSEVHPGMIAGSNLKNSGILNFAKTAMSLGVAYGAVTFVRSQGVQSVLSLGRTFASSKFLGAVDGTKNLANGALEGIKNIADDPLASAKNIGNGALDMAKTFGGNTKDAGSVIWNSFKEGKIVSDFPGVVSDIKGAYTSATVVEDAVAATEGATAVTTALATAEEVAVLTEVAVASAVAAPLVLATTFIAWAAVTVLMNTLLTGVIDEFSYNHTVSIHPLMYKDAPFVAGVRGFKTLIPGFKESDIEYKDSDEQ